MSLHDNDDFALRKNSAPDIVYHHDIAATLVIVNLVASIYGRHISARSHNKTATVA